MIQQTVVLGCSEDSIESILLFCSMWYGITAIYLIYTAPIESVAVKQSFALQKTQYFKTLRYLNDY